MKGDFYYILDFYYVQTLLCKSRLGIKTKVGAQQARLTPLHLPHAVAVSGEQSKMGIGDKENLSIRDLLPLAASLQVGIKVTNLEIKQAKSSPLSATVSLVLRPNHERRRI